MILDADVERWLREDVGHHDVTNDLPGDGEGELVARERGVAAGLDAAEAVFDYLGCGVAVPLDDGDAVGAGDVMLRANGRLQPLLRGERPATNLVCHASGVATATREAVEAARAADESVSVACTRKTTPGLRGVEKRAVVAGGGDTHRLDLSHAAMVKDNHVAALGLDEAVAHMAERVSFTTMVEVEVEDPSDASRAHAAGADAVLLDNLEPAAVERAVEEVPDDVVVEASGGIGPDDVADYAATGADVLSMGWLTHSAPALDCSFRIA